MSVLLARMVSLAATLALATPGMLSLAGCSGGPEDSTLQRSQTPAPTRLPASTKGTSGDTSPATTPPASTPDPSSSPDAGAPPPPAPKPTPPPVPGSCAAPKCFGLAGVGGCKATDSAGELVAMGCQDGACACVVGGQTTTTFDGDVNSADDARDLFLTNCTCN